MKSTTTGSRAKGSRKPLQIKSRPVPVVGLPGAPLVIAASKPRNLIAMDALLKKSGPHDEKTRANRMHARDQLKIGLDEVRRRNTED